MALKNKNIQYYLDLPWTYTIETTRETGKLLYILHVNELPGIATDAPSIEEAMELIKEAMIGAFKLYLKNGEEIPEPIDEEEFKGNIAYRTSSRRHYLLTKEAKRRNESLSHVLDQCVDLALGKRNHGF